ncbi:uncharacterized protein LOC132760258 [Ruditapes philippinarum]|uniref:uncharacterized protein LOC132760258 n=1 Tax=Ruditapes philippinarum TaxID=129788 RepID=UPI00295ADDE1|nr:uncharacterized protein LOC132760258 [Ruditapes philippinarum]
MDRRRREKEKERKRVSRLPKEKHIGEGSTQLPETANDSTRSQTALLHRQAIPQEENHQGQGCTSASKTSSNSTPSQTAMLHEEHIAKMENHQGEGFASLSEMAINSTPSKTASLHARRIPEMEKNPSEGCSSLSETVSDSTPSETALLHRQHSAEMDVGVHEYSFHGMNIDDVLRGDIDIQIMDYSCQLLRTQYQCIHGMLTPSYLHSLVSSGQNIAKKIPKNVKAVQMHYITGHYTLSARNHENITVFDSLPSPAHLKELIPQLSLLYESFSLDGIHYTTPQHQGTTTLCGVFVVANAVFCLNDIEK